MGAGELDLLIGSRIQHFRRRVVRSSLRQVEVYRYVLLCANEPERFVTAAAAVVVAPEIGERLCCCARHEVILHQCSKRKNSVCRATEETRRKTRVESEYKECCASCREAELLTLPLRTGD